LRPFCLDFKLDIELRAVSYRIQVIDLLERLCWRAKSSSSPSYAGPAATHSSEENHWRPAASKVVLTSFFILLSFDLNIVSASFFAFNQQVQVMAEQCHVGGELLPGRGTPVWYAPWGSPRASPGRAPDPYKLSAGHYSGVLACAVPVYALEFVWPSSSLTSDR
jgi:hypothetical protein